MQYLCRIECRTFILASHKINCFSISASFYSFFKKEFFFLVELTIKVHVKSEFSAHHMFLLCC